MLYTESENTDVGKFKNAVTVGAHGGVYANLFDAHPPFQIDGNFGAASGIIQWFLQCKDDIIYILPALPDDILNGKIEGIVAKGNIKLFIEWKSGVCTNYGKIGGLWFDGNWSKKGEGDIWQEDKLYSLIRKYQPDAMIITNTGLSSTGSVGHPEIDSVTYERGNARPINRDGMDKYISGEVCDSINMHWGIADDINYKSPMQILTSLVKSRSAGANYLFNVGPDSNGNIPQYPLATLNVIGKWMNIFGNAVYNGRPYWYREDSSVFILIDDKHLYFLYINLARKGSSDVTYISGTEGMIKFNDIGVNVANIKWMDNNEQLDYSKDEDDLTVNFTGYDYGTDYCVRVAVGDIV